MQDNFHDDVNWIFGSGAMIYILLLLRGQSNYLERNLLQLNFVENLRTVSIQLGLV